MDRIRRSYPVRRLHGYAIARGDLRRLSRALVRADQPDRRRLPGINADRVGTLPAAAVVIEEVMDVLGASQLVVSGQGLREGLVWRELRGERAILPDVRSSSIAGLAAANGVDIANAEPEAAVARELFDAIAADNDLGSWDLELLLHAARLAEIGTHVDFYNRDRHAEYLVHSGDLHGFSHREVMLLAAIVRWSVSGTPDLSLYRGIAEPGDERRVLVLGAMLGVARAVWRRTPSPVRAFDAQLGDGRLTLAVHADGPADAEEYALERQVRRLESVLDVPVGLEVDWPGRA
jgi:exopolyphosphatase/guanosine-5'-triphosphate,3'-diphosphate pyrophosphatase